MSKIYVIHWWVKARTIKELNNTELFHLKCLAYFNVSEIFDKIIINLSSSVSDSSIIEYIKSKAISIIGSNNIEFHYERNGSNGEYNTYKKYVLPLIATDNYVFYSHFKGLSHMNDKELWKNTLYWSFLMYKGCLSNIREVDDYFSSGKILYGSIKIGGDGNQFSRNWKNNIYMQYPELASLMSNNCKTTYHYHGSFMWINCHQLSKYLNDNRIDPTRVVSINLQNGYYISEMFISDIVNYNYSSVNSEMKNYENEYRKIESCSCKISKKRWRSGYSCYENKFASQIGWYDEFNDIVSSNNIFSIFGADMLSKYHPQKTILQDQKCLNDIKHDLFITEHIRPKVNVKKNTGNKSLSSIFSYGVDSSLFGKHKIIRHK